MILVNDTIALSAQRVYREGQQYAVSLAYDATKDEIKDIFYILEKIKTIILKG